MTLPPEQEAIRAKCFHPLGTFVEFPIDNVDTTIPERFSRIARKYPQFIAAKSNQQVITYEELDERSTDFAYAILSEQGAGTEAIGLLFNLHIPVLIAMLGALKAGKIIVLLNPKAPAARNLATLRSCRAGLIVADDENIENAQQLSEEIRIVLPLTTKRPRQSGFDLDSLGSSASLALISYTSGSTGEPKGVMQSHRSILHNVMLRTNLYRISPYERIAVPRSVTSGAVVNMFLAVLNGSGCYLFDAQKEGVPALAHWLAQEQVTVLSSSMSLFRHLAEVINRSDSCLRILQFGSQSVHRTDVELFKLRFPQECILVNLLSSTETGPLAAYAIEAAEPLVKDEIPIGFPLPDKEIILQNTQGANVGYHDVGEIVVKSRYLSNGYWNNEDLTNAKFKHDPNDPEMAIYHSGDLGVMLPDGCLIHKGRRDSRIKVRGYAVEPEEVEKSLKQHGAIQDAIVLARENNLMEDVLVAYVTMRAGSSLKTVELRSFLRGKFPDYMIPSAFVMLEAMPLTPSGKIDRQALPAPKNFRPDLGTPYVQPRTLVEGDLANIWADVLALAQVGVHDNFFDLGGHSLAASRVIARVIQTYQLEIPIKALFDAPTVAEMASLITQNQANPASEAELEHMLREVEAMTEEEVQKQLVRESTRTPTGERHE